MVPVGEASWYHEEGFQHKSEVSGKLYTVLQKTTLLPEEIKQRKMSFPHTADSLFLSHLYCCFYFPSINTSSVCRTYKENIIQRVPDREISIMKLICLQFGTVMI